jgi:hypothetical protein
VRERHVVVKATPTHRRDEVGRDAGNLKILLSTLRLHRAQRLGCDDSSKARMPVDVRRPPTPTFRRGFT